MSLVNLLDVCCYNVKEPFYVCCPILLVDSWSSVLFFVLDLYYSFLDIFNVRFLIVVEIQARSVVSDDLCVLLNALTLYNNLKVRM